jgi:hypothetical protein
MASLREVQSALTEGTGDLEILTLASLAAMKESDVHGWVQSSYGHLPSVADQVKGATRESWGKKPLLTRYDHLYNLAGRRQERTAAKDANADLMRHAKDAPEEQRAGSSVFMYNAGNVFLDNADAIGDARFIAIKTKLQSELVDLATLVFQDAEIANDWLTEPNMATENQPPITFCSSIAGIKSITNLLQRIQYGVLA